MSKTDITIAHIYCDTSKEEQFRVVELKAIQRGRVVVCWEEGRQCVLYPGELNAWKTMDDLETKKIQFSYRFDLFCTAEDLLACQRQMFLICCNLFKRIERTYKVFSQSMERMRLSEAERLRLITPPPLTHIVFTEIPPTADSYTNCLMLGNDGEWKPIGEISSRGSLDRYLTQQGVIAFPIDSELSAIQRGSK